MDDPEVPPADLDTARLAIEWAREAGELTLGYFRSEGLVVERKGDGTPVTRADQEAEALLRERISSVFADDAIYGEEHDDLQGTSGRSWVIDPIDGTKAFSRGVATYSNLVEFSDAHGPAIGIINLPALQECVWAARGHGCFFGDSAVHVAREGRDDGPLEGRILCVSGFHEWDRDLFGRVQDAGVEVRTWGDAYGYALVATGRADAMFDPSAEWWDLAAPAVVVREAGGIMTRWDGDHGVHLPDRDGAYGHSAIASATGDHDLWVSLLARD